MIAATARPPTAEPSGAPLSISVIPRAFSLRVSQDAVTRLAGA
nr:hypothetical protein [Nocardia coffeae]